MIGVRVRVVGLRCMVAERKCAGQHLTGRLGIGQVTAWKLAGEHTCSYTNGCDKSFHKKGNGIKSITYAILMMGKIVHGLMM